MSKPMFVVFLTVVLDLIGFGIVIPLLTFYAETFHATPVQVTLLMTCYSAAQFLFAPIWGQLSDRIGRRPVLVGSIFLTAVSLALFASSTALWMLFAFRTLHGIMTANISTAQACMADLTTPETRAKGMGLIGAGFGIGFTIGPFLGGELSQFGLAVPMWVAAGLSFVNFALAFFILPETRKPDSMRAHRRISPIAMVHAVAHPVLGLAILLSFVQVFSFALMESTFTLFAEPQHGLSAAKVGEMFGLIGVVSMIIQGGLIGRLVKRFGERPLIPVGLALLTIGLTLIPLVGTGAPLLFTFALMAVGQSIVTPSLQSMLSRAASADDQGGVLGSAQSMGALARATGPLLGGILYDKFMPAAPFWTAAFLLAGAVVLAIPATARVEAGRVA